MKHVSEETLMKIPFQQQTEEISGAAVLRE